MPTPLTALLDELVHAHLNQVFPACSIAVYHQGQWIADQAWGWIDPDAKAQTCTPETYFDLASLTKLFTVTAFLRLVSQNKVTLDDSLTQVIPEFGEGGARGIDGGVDPHSKQAYPLPDNTQDTKIDPAQVTFRHLLTHTSGLAAWRPVYQAAGDAPPPPTQPDPISRQERWSRGLDFILSAPFVSQPGAQILYSDLGLILLGEAVSRLNHAPLEHVIQAQINQPLGLNSLVFCPMDAGVRLNQIAPTELDSIWRNRRVWGEVHDENARGLGGVAGHAGLFGTAKEIARFGLAWLQRDDLLGINPSLLDDAVRDHAVVGNERRGLGWMLKSLVNSSAGDQLSMHSYGHTGFTGTSLWIDPDAQLVCAVLTNRVYFGRHVEGIHTFRRAVHHLIADSLT